MLCHPMMASRTTAFVMAALCASALAMPRSANSLKSMDAIAKRDNKYHLKCSNAPATIGGYPLDPATVPPFPRSLPQTGSDKDNMKFMWCTPGTKTYTFFGQWELTPPPLDYIDMVAAINMTGSSYQNQADIAIPDGRFTVDPAGTNVQVHMENAKGKLTWGIANAALRGLWQFLSIYGEGDARMAPIVFQVNDGEWGEVGIGYAAFLRPADGKCLLNIYQGKDFECKDLKKLIN